MFCNFCKKFENSKWSPFLARQTIFDIWVNYSAEIPYGSKISTKPLSLAQFSRYKCFCVLQFLRKIRKFKMAAIFGETKFFENWVFHSAYTLRVENFVEIALSRSISEINTFLRLTQKFKMAAKIGGKTFLQKVASRLCIYPVGQKFCQNRSISLHFQDKRVFAFNAEIQDDHQKWRENNFCKR